MDKSNYAPGTVTERAKKTIIKRGLGSLSIEVAITNRSEVLAFLTARAGKPFRLDPMGGNNPGPIAWRCLQCTFRWPSPGLWIFVAEFKEVGGKWI